MLSFVIHRALHPTRQRCPRHRPATSACLRWPPESPAGATSVDGVAGTDQSMHSVRRTLCARHSCQHEALCDTLMLHTQKLLSFLQ
jgi:hypothetical protein